MSKDQGETSTIRAGLTTFASRHSRGRSLTYRFHPNIQLRMSSLLLFGICSCFAFLFAYLDSFRFTPGWSLFVFAYSAAAIAMFVASLSEVVVNTEPRKLVIRRLFSSTTHALDQLVGIVGETRSYTHGPPRPRTLFHLELIGGQRVRLNVGLKAGHEVTDRFAANLEHLSRELQIGYTNA